MARVLINPHFWKNTAEHYQHRKDIFADLVVIHFKKEAFGNDFFNLPEMQVINRFLLQSSKGIAITGKSNHLIADKMMQMLETNGLNRFMGLMEVLQIAAEHEEDWEILSKNDYSSILSFKDSVRLQKVFQFISENYDRPIPLEEIAEVADMNKTAFSRYFKRTTNKGFVEYLNEVRINYAKKLLVAHPTPINTVGYLCGFSNPSYFNKTFKAFEGITPNEYKLRNG